MNETVWYLDWQFWAAVAAFLAIILSQLPPIRLWFKRGKLEINKSPRILVHHNVGTPNINMFLSIENIGGSVIRIGSIKLKLSRDGTELPLMTGSEYYDKPDSQRPTMFTAFDIKPEQTWEHTVNFHEIWNRAQQQKHRLQCSKMREVITEKQRVTPQPNTEPHTADEKDIEAVHARFEKNNQWYTGEFKCTVYVYDTHGNELKTDEFKFTLFESEEAEFRTALDDYKYGNGVCYPVTQKQIGIWVDLAT